MKSIAIFYGSTTGVTEDIANRIASAIGLSSDKIYGAAELSSELISQNDVLILGSSTWGCGDLQDDWYDALEVLKKSDLKGKKIALFGVGDSSSYSDTFCDAIGIIYDALKDSGAEFAGMVETSGYTYDGSAAVVGDKFVGLAIDEDNESSLTDNRISEWTSALEL